MQILFNVGLSAVLISIALWISKKNPVLGGFVVSLPLSTLIILAISKLQNPNTEASYTLAKSIFIGIPSTLVFFVPFLLADRFKLSFWTCYASGFAFLGFGYFIHRSMTSFLMK